jgi:hypothetical protein
MDIDLYVGIGLNTFTRRHIGALTLDPDTIGATSQWAGSYHVLSMDRHYDDYVVAARILSLPDIPDFPAAHPYERLTGKIRATSVTGNIGEAIAALFARRAMKARIQDIAHVRPRQPFLRRRAPDYLMKLGPLMPGAFEPVLRRLSGSPTFSWPDWWPVESKARATDSGVESARRDALKQLMDYWSLIARSRPEHVGFGVIVTFSYQFPQQVHATLILPRQQEELRTALLQLRPLRNPIDLTWATYLHGC